ncbi:tRNA lysidine(34) synthetase TilS [Salisediminibacterium selenitireducens]|uniref:tRNA(Ile)-lysidine synthase n=1 Tax=Bacillus selenitireducens (strain ATCC 700615 / DSM 15326 / MLS10) TaxID=439292 RepID=D6XV57_BACIE|nr:tRNA lysidine(34) synthetase TilS [Salisediminibacterium selenitireducens]ADH97615.1 tRNA(Ile)-lysidine synthetase [[Bacillus] selenitireducens MLS10]
MNQTIDAFIDRHRLIQAGDHLLVAVSGGVDSMVLLHLLHERRTRLSITLSAVHAHHHLRRESADRDAELVASFCRELAIPFHLVHLSVEEERKLRNGSVQAVARDLRYEAFRHVMTETGANRLVTAHHGDDQIETVLLQLLRNTAQGGSGMRALRPIEGGTLIRPLLDTEKASLYRYAKDSGIPFREDESNDSRHYRRNRIRQDILPVLKEEHPGIHRQIGRYTEERQTESDYLDHLADEMLQEPSFSLMMKESGLQFSRPAFQRLPSALQKRAVHLLLTYLSEHLRIRVAHNRRNLEQAVAVICGEKPNAAAFFHDGLKLVCAYGLVTIGLTDESLDSFSSFVIQGEGEWVLPTGTLSCRLSETEDPLPETSAQAVTVPGQMLPITVRPRKPGDRITLRSGEGRKKLKKIMIDEKIPQSMRDVWPILVDRHDTILWAPELAVSGELLRIETGHQENRHFHIRFQRFEHETAILE